ncbi:MAG: fibronectin type III domain-containing protein, partial [bacterium]|nr:fibronectin type III domain-containing protein [bacterium]
KGKVALKDHYANLVSGRRLSLESAKDGLQVDCWNNCQSNSKGEVFFNLVSDQPGLFSLVVSDVLHGGRLFQADVGFLPVVNKPSVQPDRSWDDLFSSADQDPTRAQVNSLGNDDQAIARLDLFSTIPNFSSASLFNMGSLSADLVSPPVTAPMTPPVTASTAGQIAEFHIIFGTDEDQEFEEEVTVQANSALDYYVIPVDANGDEVTSYRGTIVTEIDPAGPLVPPPFTFRGLPSENFFALALLLPPGEWTLTVEDQDNPNLFGEVTITSSLPGQSPRGVSNGILTVNNPVGGNVYSGTIPVNGVTATDNTKIQVLDSQGSLLQEALVDANNAFNFSVNLPSGPQTLTVKALYQVTGQEVSSAVTFEVDTTAPVVTRVNVPSAPIRPDEAFTITAEAEAESTLVAFIDNRSYNFTGTGTQYTLSAQAPPNGGSFPVHVRASDRLGNSIDLQNQGILTVQGGLTPLANLIGIPGVGQMTLSWDPVPGADHYRVSYRAVLGTLEQQQTAQEAHATVASLSPSQAYIFTVVAQDAQGASLSLPTVSGPLQALEPEATPALVQGGADHAAASVVQTTPIRHASSGPEVYVVVIMSALLMVGYVRMRKASVAA